MSPLIGCKRGLDGHPEGLPDFSYVWLEAPLAAKLGRREEIESWQDLETWPAGRIFGEEGEYRWQRLPDNKLHAVLLLESAPLPPIFESVIELEEVERASLVLWGEWVNPEGDPEGNPDGGPSFYTQEIPEIQRYPIDLGGSPPLGATPRLRVRRYRDSKGTHGEHIRCVGLTLTPAGKNDHG